MLNEILKYNQEFVTSKQYKQYETSKYPDRQIAIVSCMDTRLIELLPAALGFRNGDVKIIKNAGGIITHPFGSVMRSLLIGVYELNIKEIYVIGHTDCGAKHVDGETIRNKMQKNGISEEIINVVESSGINITEWIDGFQQLDQSIIKSVEIVRKHPLIPKEIKVYGLTINSNTGELKVVDDASE